METKECVLVAFIIVLLIVVSYIVYTKYSSKKKSEGMKHGASHDSSHSLNHKKEKMDAGSGLNAGIMDRSVDNFNQRSDDGLLQPWSTIIEETELEASTKASHREFVQDVLKATSSGPAFTSVLDDNISPTFTNYVGFKKPQFVPIGEGARQVPDVDEHVLKRNKNAFAYQYQP